MSFILSFYPDDLVELMVDKVNEGHNKKGILAFGNALLCFIRPDAF